MVADPENPLVLNILHASSSAYSFDPDSQINEVGSLGQLFSINMQSANVTKICLAIATEAHDHEYVLCSV